MQQGLRWGIIGTGGIAHKFAETLVCEGNGSVLAAVGSRKKDTALTFGGEYGVPAERCFGSYEALCACPEVDIVYIATPHSLHAENALTALSCGKHILAEKAFALNPAQSAAVFDCAAQKGLFACEAMWTRFLPANRGLVKALKEGAVGELHMADASFGAHMPEDWPPTHRIYAKDCGGGALLDMGVYPQSWLSMLADDREPVSVATLGALFNLTQVDERNTVLCGYGDGFSTVSCCGIKTALSDEGHIYGSMGHIVAPHFWNCSEWTLVPDSGTAETFSFEKTKYGLKYELYAAVADILAGRTVSSVVPPSATLCVQRILYKARMDRGVIYPQEEDNEPE